MKTSSKNAGYSTASDSLLDISETAIEPSEDPRLRAIETLETRMFRGFGEIEGELDEWERRLVECVRRTIEEIRVENVESMEAVQLDLEVLRHKVSSQASHDSPGFIDQLNSAVCIDTCFDMDLPAFHKLITDHLRVTYRLPSATVKLPESENPSNTVNECFLFETEETNAKTDPADEETIQKSVETPAEASRSPHRKSRNSRISRGKRTMVPPFALGTRVVVAILYAGCVGVFVHAALSTI